MNDTDKVETLRWKDGALEMIDQRFLPHRVEYVRFDSAAGVAEGIRNMVVRGAPAIGCAAAYGIALEAQKHRDKTPVEFAGTMTDAFTILGASRPTAVNLFWVLSKMRRELDALGERPPAEISDRLTSIAHEVLAHDIEVNRAIGAIGARLIPDGSRILTHCNAGSLATAGHGTALGVVRSVVEGGKKASVIVGETRPFLQGARLTVWEMMQEGIPVTLVTDNMTGHLMAKGEIDTVIVGTDRVAANGDVANKIGTYMIAVLAKKHGIPFYVACPLSSIDMSMESGAAIPIEERGSDEVTGYGEVQWAAKGVTVRNPSFDVTPAELVTALITEKGAVFEPDAEKLALLFNKTDATAESV